MQCLEPSTGRSTLENAVILLCVDIQGFLIDRVGVNGGGRSGDVVAVAEEGVVVIMIDSISRAVN